MNPKTSQHLQADSSSGEAAIWLAQNNGKSSVTYITVSIEAIFPSQFQTRRYFEPKAMDALVESVRRNGILHPLLVRPIETEKYELVAGERRYRAAKEALLAEVPVVVRPMTDESAWECALADNLQRQDLNPVEETEGILQLLALKLKIDSNAVISLLNKMAKVNRGRADNVIRPEDKRIVEETFAAIGRLTPESFRSNRLPLLNLPEDILAALRLGRIAYTKAKAIARIKDSQKRSELLEQAIASGWSLRQIKTRTASQLEEKSPPVALAGRLDRAYKQVKTSLTKQQELWQNPETQQRLEELLAELEALVGN